MTLLRKLIAALCLVGMVILAGLTWLFTRKKRTEEERLTDEHEGA